MPDQNSASRRLRRAKGTGTEPRWIPERARWQLQITLPDGKRRTLRHADKTTLEVQRDVLLKDMQQMRRPAYERSRTTRPQHDPSEVESTLLYWITQILLQDTDLLDRIAEKVALRLGKQPR